MSIKYPVLELWDLESEEADNQKHGKPIKSRLSSTGQRTKKGWPYMMADLQTENFGLQIPQKNL